MSVKGIVIVNENNRVVAMKYGPYTSADLEPENEYLLEVESFPDQDPIQALYNPADSTFTYDDVWTARQTELETAEAARIAAQQAEETA